MSTEEHTPGTQIITDVGRSKHRDAIANGSQVAIAHVALGNGGGSLYDPSGDMTALIGEFARQPIGSQRPVGDDEILTRTTFPKTIPFDRAREVGFFDEDGDLIFIWAGADFLEFATGGAEQDVDHTFVLGAFEGDVITIKAPLKGEELVSLINDTGGVNADTLGGKAPGEFHIKEFYPPSVKSLVAASGGAGNGYIIEGQLGGHLALGVRGNSATDGLFVASFHDGTSAHDDYQIELLTVTPHKFQYLGKDIATKDEAKIVGEIIQFAGPARPAGFLECNGAAISRASYAALFEQIGETYGSGNGTTTFNLPDLRGQFVRGSGNGRAVGTDQGDAIRNITGQMNFRAADGATDIVPYTNGAFHHEVETEYGSSGQLATTTGNYGQRTFFDASNVVPTADENRPQNTALMFCIRY